MCKRQENTLRKGFSLVEIIVVLVVLAVLAAIMVPSLVRWIDKSEEKQAILEARSCVVATEAIAVERYAVNRTYDLAADKAETLTLAETPKGGDIQLSTVDNRAMVTKLVYVSPDKITVTYENGEYRFSRIAGTDFSDSDALSKIYPTMNSVLGGATSRYYYSGTNDIAGVTDALKEQGLDLDAMAATWSIRYNRNNEYPKLYWTNESLSGHSAGDVIPVMAYTLSTGRYTVWNVRLVNVNGSLGLGTEVNKVTTVDSPDQSYAQMLTDYSAATSH